MRSCGFGVEGVEMVVLGRVEGVRKGDLGFRQMFVAGLGGFCRIWGGV